MTLEQIRFPMFMSVKRSSDVESTKLNDRPGGSARKTCRRRWLLLIVSLWGKGESALSEYRLTGA